MVKVYVPGPRSVRAIRNTDWHYPSLLTRLPEFTTNLEVLRTTSIPFDSREHLIFAIDLLRRRVGVPLPYAWAFRWSQFYRLPRHDVAERLADVVLAFERYPNNTSKPVVWITGPTEVDKLRARGLSDRQIDGEVMFKRECLSRAAATLVTTEYARHSLISMFEPRRSPIVIPPLIPLRTTPLSDIAHKWRSPEPLRLVFLGRAANRKGLPLVIEAFQDLLAHYPGKANLQIISDFRDGEVAIPQRPEIQQERALPREDAVAAIAKAHVLLMPSSYESYGWAYIEAMARGTIPLASSHPVQRELLQDGEAGILVERRPLDITEALIRLIERPTRAYELALSARRAWDSRYCPPVVGDKYMAVLGSISH